jgi:hypothetical protein
MGIEISEIVLLALRSPSKRGPRLKTRYARKTPKGEEGSGPSSTSPRHKIAQSNPKECQPLRQTERGKKNPVDGLQMMGDDSFRKLLESTQLMASQIREQHQEQHTRPHMDLKAWPFPKHLSGGTTPPTERQSQAQTLTASMDSELRSLSFDSAELNDMLLEAEFNESEPSVAVAQPQPQPHPHSEYARANRSAIKQLAAHGLSTSMTMLGYNDTQGCAEALMQTSLQLLALDLPPNTASHLRSTLGAIASCGIADRIMTLRRVLEMMQAQAEDDGPERQGGVLKY